MQAETEAVANELKVEERHLEYNADEEEEELADILRSFALKDKTVQSILRDLRKQPDINNTL